MAMRLYDGRGKPVALGRELGSGGEGAVLEVTHDPGFVAKVYHKAVDPAKVNKLGIMARIATPELLKISAWPTGTLHDKPNGDLVGILLPKVTKHHEVHELYSPAQRKIHFPKADWSFLVHVAMNCATAFETVHHAGHVIGDVNPGGVMVADHGMVRLIDCDSFQIRQNGRLFYCEVGVPQYTPPELQGVNFRGVERTHGHDCFGLAVLIFHLLFMGRHPFAGRFSGTGDMPIERAISEGRFAFGRAASSVQMTPPPHSLPLAALPPAIGSLFERAFARPSANLSRPSACEWRQAITALKAGLRQCQADSGHRYPSQLSRCPWCEIMHHGGPNFFISIQVVAAGVKYELPAFDAAAAWARIEIIAPPPSGKPPIPAFTKLPTPMPLPDDVQDQVVMIRIARIVFAIAVVATIIGIFTSYFVLVFGFAITLIMGVWWAAAARVSGYRREMDRRREERRRAAGVVRALESRWDGIVRDAGKRFEALKRELFEAKQEIEHLAVDFERERRDIESKKRDMQLQSFLEKQFIRDHKIPRIGRGRIATLLSYGIETAADVNEADLDQIPGFGPSLIDELLSWRMDMMSRFRFDPNQATPPAQMQALFMKYRQRHQRAQAYLTRGPQELSAIGARARAQLGELVVGLEHATAEYRQAEANMRGA